MGKLVKDGVITVFVCSRRDPGAKEQVVAMGYASGVFHGARIELRDERLGVLTERVRVPELGLVDLEPALGSGPNAVGVEVFRDRLTAQNVGINFSRRRMDCPVIDMVFTGDESREVSRNREGGFKRPPRHPLPRTFGRFRSGGVRNDGPTGRCDDLQLEGHLLIGLLKVRVHAPGVSNFELGV